MVQEGRFHAAKPGNECSNFYTDYSRWSKCNTPGLGLGAVPGLGLDGTLICSISTPCIALCFSDGRGSLAIIGSAILASPIPV